MANASVEKLKALGIRHGEKAVVGLTAALFVVFTAMAIMRETLPMNPEELASAANSASANLSKQQAESDVLAKLEKDGLVEPKLALIVDSQMKNALKPDAFRAKLDWVTPEPGAGLIRDQPELIAPTELAAFPGRGGILMYALDSSGQRVIDTGEDAKKGGKKSAKKKSNEEKPEDKRRREAEEEKRKKMFTENPDAVAKEKAKEEAPAEPAAPAGPWKEETKGRRWVVITGVIDNEQLKKNYLLALKNPAIAYPNYKRLDVERRSLQEDGTWSEWEATNQDKNYEVLDNLPVLETEVVPEPKRPPALVDPLPFLKAGYWSGVHVAQLVPTEILEGPKTKPAGPGGGGAMSGGTSFGGGPNQDRSSSMPGGMASGGNGSSGTSAMNDAPSAGGPGSGDSQEANFTKIEEKSLMLRSLDFTVEPDSSYQFRLRIVVVNPNYTHTDVNPGVDVESKELLGPWSEPTDPVTVPADVAAYAQAPEPARRRDDLVNFQVIKWDSVTGQTVVKNDDAGPGELIGENGSIQMPSSEGKGPEAKTIDFNSRAIVLDTFGGPHRLPDIGLDRNQFMVPAVAMIVEPDGAVVIRDQAMDRADDVRDNMESGYKQALADSKSKREVGSSSLGGDPRMSGGKKKKKARR
jgi:hypothetical protein